MTKYDWDAIEPLYKEHTVPEIYHITKVDMATLHRHALDKDIETIDKKTKAYNYLNDFMKKENIFSHNTLQEISESTNISIEILSSYARDNNIQITTKWDKYSEYLGFMSDKDLAELTNIKPNSVTVKRIRLGIEAPKRRMMERVVQERLTDTLNDYEEFVRLNCGIADVVTYDTIYEVKVKLTQSLAQKAVGQLLLYQGSLPDHKLCIVAETEILSDSVKERLEELDIQLLII